MNYHNTAYIVAAPSIALSSTNPHTSKETYQMTIYFKDQAKMNELMPYPRKDERTEHSTKENHVPWRQATFAPPTLDKLRKVLFYGKIPYTDDGAFVQ